ncbi:PQQ-dependent sugar dehydrogenase [Xylanimonas oleitrophica]|uniref:PQQ-dependent sugar dehydrogenase n=1 Tax=Xylanimonas oleitrophica TaxID=2607479 RepID=A0A2W5WS99_9MICO|nr:PQQ-dependent sugar dehydrogenase [Xylanimonas oleitrophica]PZR54227.1 PQQ-dependent sugar dehydrogenase [Xylanimonas oleitrophica]
MEHAASRTPDRRWPRRRWPRRRCHRPPAAPTVVLPVVLSLVLAACGAGGEAGERVTPPISPPAQTAPPSAQPEAPAGGVPEAHEGAVTAQVRTVATGLTTPWGLARLPGGSLLVSLRDEGRLVVVDPASGSVDEVTGPGADELAEQTVARGEGGLLGVAVAPTPADAVGRTPAGGDTVPQARDDTVPQARDDTVPQARDDTAPQTRDGAVPEARDGGSPADRVAVYVYRTGADDNAVLRGVLDVGSTPTLGALTPVVEGIPTGSSHDGGQVAFGPDGHLYVATGDAGDRESAQDLGSLAGKVLRVTGTGEPAPGNPFDGSPVWSLGHRNVQGLGWDPAGRMLASEFGAAAWDELNQVVPGGNYGWPDVEGAADGEVEPAYPGGPPVVDGFVDPLVTWPPADASPSGLAVTAEGVYLAALRGERLWRVPLLGTDGATAGEEVRLGEPQELLTAAGRLRAVVADPDGSLWVLTSNTDGRGAPGADDDRLLHVTLAPS